MNVRETSEYIEGLEIIHKAYQHMLNKYPEIKENKPLYTEEEVKDILYDFLNFSYKNPPVKSYLPLNDFQNYVSEWWEDYENKKK